MGKNKFKIILLFALCFTIASTAFAQVDIEPGGEHEFSYTTYTSFMPSNVSVNYQVDGSSYFS